MIPFFEAARRVRELLREAGYPASRIAIEVPYADVLAMQREEEMAKAMVREAMNPSEPKRGGLRLVAIVEGVHVYTREVPP